MKKKASNIIIISLILLLIVGVSVYASYGRITTVSLSPYPNGKNFAFTITDDPDETKLEKIRPIYALLDDLGFKTTIACWVYKPEDLTGMPDQDTLSKSETLENEEYVRFLKEYQRKGFEIALHTVTAGNDERNVTMNGYERFKEVFGDYPKINIMHSKNKENIYWGKNAFGDPIMKKIVDFYTKVDFSGENPKSRYFWGDTCMKNTQYVRMWGTRDINTLKFNPSMPYHDPSKPYVNYWFSFSDGFTVKYFNSLLSDRNIDKLVRERGVSIVYTHLACGFTKRQKDGSLIVDETAKTQLVKLSKCKDGWFVPASTIFDRLLLLRNLAINKSGNTIYIKNCNPMVVKGITFVTKPNMLYKDMLGNPCRANEEGEIIIEDIEPNEERLLPLSEETRLSPVIKNQNFFEKVNLVIERLKIMIFSHRG